MGIARTDTLHAEQVADTTDDPIPLPAAGYPVRPGHLYYVQIECTEATSLTTLDANLEYSLDGGTNWFVAPAGVENFAQLTDVGVAVLGFTALGTLVRIAYDITATDVDYIATITWDHRDD